MTTSDTKTTTARRLRRIAAWTAIAVGAVIVLVVVALSLPGVRGRILREAIVRADGALPGTLVIERAAWPSPGTIDLTGLTWTDDGDTLARAARLRVAVHLWPLARRDVDIDSVELAGAYADIPAITERFPSPSDTIAATPGEPGRFPREGSVAGVPSIAVRRVTVTADSIRMGDGDVLAGIDLAASADLLRDHRPAAQIERLAVHGQARAWGVERMDVDIDLARGLVDGRIHGQAGPHWPFFVTLASDARDRYTIRASTVEGADPPDDTGARISLGVERDGPRVQRIEVAADIRTPGVEELAANPALANALASAPPLEGVVAHIDAVVALTSSPTVAATLTIAKNAWLEGARVEATYRDGVTDVTGAHVAMDGLDLQLRARADHDSLDGGASIDVSGGTWLEKLSPESRLPDGFAGRADISVRGALPLETVHAEIVARTMGYHGGLSAEITRGDDTTVRLSPVLVRARPITRAPGLDSRAGTVHIARTGDMRAQGVRITGDFGQAIVDATIDKTGHGNATVAARWPELPAPLMEALGLEPVRADSLRTLWKQHGPFKATVRAEIADGVQARATVDLPGPRTLAPLLPANARVDDLGNITGTFDVRVGAGDDRRIDVVADLGSTAWIDTATVRMEIRDGRARVDTMTIAIASLRAGGAGTASADSLDGRARITIGDAEFIRRFAPDVPDIELQFDAIATGASTAPGISADLSGVVAGNRIAGRARVSSDGADIQLRAPDGLTLKRARFDVAEITIANDNRGARFFPARVTVNLSGDDLSVYHTASVDDAHGFTLAGDTLGIVIGGRGLHTRHPFALRVGPDPGLILVDGLDMTGTLGRVTVDAILSSDSAVVDADISVQMPEKPASLALPDNYWPGSATARIRATADGRIGADLAVGGVTLSDGRRPDVSAGFESTGEEIRILIAVTEGDTMLLDGRGRLPAAVSLTPPSFHAGEGAAEVELHAREVPLALRMDDADNGRIMLFSGDARLSGTMSAPAGTLSAVVEFPGWPKLEGYRAAFESTVNAGTGDDAVDARLRLSKDGAQRMSASIQYAGALSMAPPFVPDAGGRLEIHARSESLSLGEFDALLPADVGMSGSLQIRLDAEGPPRNPTLDGQIDAAGVEVTLKQNMRLLSNGRVTLSGDVAAPVARGDIVIESGLIQIPAPPPELHAASGTSLLLGQRVVPEDTTVAPVPPGEAKPVRADVDISVSIPGALWIRGQGLEVELAGSLRLHQQGGQPQLSGELRAVRGSLLLLGRSFQLERGTVVFYGDDEINPTLDVQLATTIDGTTITVVMTGTAAEPELTLRSTPEMEEGDIMSYLVFGRALDNLDQDQKSLVETRATEIAAAMGAARLQDELRKQLGVDMVTIRGASASDESSALVIGKYLNPRLLIKYERLLEEQAAQFINIEYFLTRRLKIDALYGRNDQQGLEIEWSNEY